MPINATPGRYLWTCRIFFGLNITVITYINLWKIRYIKMFVFFVIYTMLPLLHSVLNLCIHIGFVTVQGYGSDTVWLNQSVLKHDDLVFTKIQFCFIHTLEVSLGLIKSPYPTIQPSRQERCRGGVGLIYRDSHKAKWMKLERSQYFYVKLFIYRVERNI